jgi:acyl carrier protein
MSVNSGIYVDPTTERHVTKTVLENQAGAHDEAFEDLLEGRFVFEEQECELRTLSSVIDAEAIERIDLLKIDVEKSERDVLAGIADHDWPKIQQVVIEVHDIEGRLEEVQRLLAEHGFEVVAFQKEDLVNTGIHNVYAVRPSFRLEVPSVGAESWRIDNLRPPEGPADIQALREHLREQLPQHMQPSTFTLLDHLPVTRNGKLDVAALQAEARQVTDTARGAPPQGHLEQALAAIWKDVLGVQAVSRTDHFFDVGGHSLMAVKVAARVRDQLGIDLPVRLLFETSSLQALAERLSGATRDASPIMSPISAMERAGAPATAGQARLWRQWVAEPEGRGHRSENLGYVFDLKGSLDRSALEEAVRWVVDRHDALRTVFAPGDEELSQTVLAAGAFALRFEEIETPEHVLPDCVALACEKPFDLARESPFRALLVKRGADAHILALVGHHIVLDGWSVEIVLSEIIDAYNRRRTGTVLSKDRPLQFSDYVAWLQAPPRRAALDGQAAYWRACLPAKPPFPILPFDRDDSAGDRVVPEISLGFVLSPTTREGLGALVSAHRVTPMAVLMTALRLMVRSYSDEQDFCVLLATANRRNPDTHGIVGRFFNYLAVQPRAGAATAADLITRVHAAIADGFENQELPFEAVYGGLHGHEDIFDPPFADIAMTFAGGGEGPSFEGLTVAALPAPGVSNLKRSLNVGFVDADGKIDCAMRFNANRFSPARAEQMSRRWQAALDALVSWPDASLDGLIAQIQAAE